MKTGNIRNLTSLWLLIGKAFNANQIISEFEIVNLSFSQWPNRIWSSKPIASDRKDVVKEIILRNNSAMTFSVFEELNEKNHARDYDMKVKSLQVGMSLSLADYYFLPLDSSVDAVLVEDREDAELWSILFKQSFGYVISDKVVTQIMDQVEFYNIKFNNLFVGTVAIYKLDNSIGIHSLGIIPQFRNRGLAKKMMMEILSKAKNNNMDYAYLQSSFMGINIYKKLGFREQFYMYNYGLG